MAEACAGAALCCVSTAGGGAVSADPAAGAAAGATGGAKRVRRKKTGVTSKGILSRAFMMGGILAFKRMTLSSQASIFKLLPKGRAAT